MSSPVPLNDPLRVAEEVRRETGAAVQRVLDGGRYILGDEVARFEEAFAAFCGCRWGIGVGNGTDAIEIALRAAGVGPGDHVLHVANAGFYGTAALRAIGAVPVFVDVDPTSHMMDPRDLERKAGPGAVKAVLATHLYGRLAPMDEIMRLGLPVVEDCAQAHGARRGGKMAGSFGAAAAFSFYPTKNLGALGDGGAVLTNDEGIAARARSLRQYGWQSKYRVALSGGRNSRLDEMQAAILTAKLPFLDGWNRRRRAIAERYRAAISHPSVTLPPAAGESDCVHLYVLLCPRRDLLAGHLKERGIQTDIHYPVPDHLQAIMQNPPSLPVSEDLAGRVLSLPCFPGLEDAEIDRVAAAVNDWGDPCTR